MILLNEKTINNVTVCKNELILWNKNGYLNIYNSM